MLSLFPGSWVENEPDFKTNGQIDSRKIIGGWGGGGGVGGGANLYLKIDSRKIIGGEGGELI